MTVTTPHPVHPDFSQEERHLSGTIASVLYQIGAWEDRSRNVGADLETSLVLADEAEEKAAMLSVHVAEPYFGSLSVRIAGRDQTLYVGKHAHRDLTGPFSVVSWESDVGGLFYSQALEWTTPRRLKGTIHRRRQLDVHRKVLRGVVDLYDSASGGETGGREEVLLKRLAEASSSGMRDVVETLQAEQHDVMRAPAGQYVCIQGAAGSGKTTIGFHRLAWLVHPERGENQAERSRILVLMPNQVLAHYAARVLPGLNLEGVVVTTPETWALGFLGLEKMEVTDRTLSLLLTDHDNGRRRAAWRRAKALGDLRMLQVVRNHLKARLGANLGALDYHGTAEVSRGQGGSEPKELHLSALQVRGLLEGVLRREPLEGYRPALRAALEAELLGQSGVTEDQEAGVLRQLGSDLNRLMSRIFAGMLPVTEARRLLQSEESLRSAAEGVLSEQTIGVLLTDPLVSVAKPRRSYADVTELPLMLAVAGLLDGLGRRQGRELLPYDEVLLDEGQDFAPLLYALLARAARPGHITTLGDLNQGLHGYKGPSGWPEVLGALGSGSQGSGQLLTLSRTYRSTRQITELTARVAATYNRAADVVGVDRSGAEVRRLTGGPLARLTAQAVKEMQLAGHLNIAIVTRRTADAELLSSELMAHDVDARPILNEQARYQGGVVILPVHLAKGLEFDAALVCGADAGTYDPATEFESRLLYIAASRGVHALALIAETDLHPLLLKARTD
ncbi:ATP-binding domain-containing protein [Deinococcus altitudinis]|uniref:ATP-binding domain-containing protein n=1 Tax=Deinococcus altitudinis TaxID=468914 RepID=UPI0038921F33